MSTLKTPRPTTRVAWLPSAGYGLPRATKHTYVDTRECVVPGTDGAAWEHVFKCEETGEERRWGIESRHDYAPPSAAPSDGGGN